MDINSDDFINSDADGNPVPVPMPGRIGGNSPAAKKIPESVYRSAARAKIARNYEIVGLPAPIGLEEQAAEWALRDDHRAAVESVWHGRNVQQVIDAARALNAAALASNVDWAHPPWGAMTALMQAVDALDSGQPGAPLYYVVDGRRYAPEDVMICFAEPA